MNLTAMSAFLRPHHAIIAADSAHICVPRNRGYRSYRPQGHQLSFPDGKIQPSQIEEAYLLHKDQHMVKRKLVYISNTTEVGTVLRKTGHCRLFTACATNTAFICMPTAHVWDVP